MNIENVLTDEDLQKKMDKLKSEHWLVNKIARCTSGAARNQIDNWPTPTRQQLLEFLGIYENVDYKSIYHNKDQ